MTKTTFALIGTGIVGERIINQILAHPNAEIVAIFDGNQARLQEVADKYAISAVATLDELLATKPDWVYIGTPPVSHAPLAKEIAAHGLNILSEKPLAHDAQDGAEMVRVASEAGVHTAMHFPLMYSPAVHEIKQALANKELGDIVRIELHTYFPEWPRKWQQNPWIASREQGGFIREVFPHYLQLMHHFFGDIDILSHETTYPEDVSLCETGVSALAKTSSGIPVVLNGLSGIGQEERLEFKVFGTEKVMTLRNWSELWVSVAYEAAQQISPSAQPASLLDACRVQLHGEDALIVSFEEGLKVQKWIDELLK
ncbi:Gfo/Idh/MocA family oxidoreductase [Metasolibacillus meyeri]|uniref:Gfo/Idh/MocA family oxidoreductase n=1 Tax=Metasolibacillus meyeri TaxID=1071052 RepID=A0AAW9NQK7_9BACL|nr:Gfo/Idh/MocA family oxidoreductase [Metasolibacillus meyeri]MEC1178617.1 Gfo/Idh/MocA family oxidoreductase [Metasolibacillus meyeri]